MSKYKILKEKSPEAKAERKRIKALSAKQRQRLLHHANYTLADRMRSKISKKTANRARINERKRRHKEYGHPFADRKTARINGFQSDIKYLENKMREAKGDEWKAYNHAYEETIMKLKRLSRTGAVD